MGRPGMAPFNVRAAASDRYHGPLPAIALPQPLVKNTTSAAITSRVAFACDPGKRTRPGV
jgi:hypothetical protein